jgi:uncharacterized repeat protein (TIGR03806 family)
MRLSRSVLVLAAAQLLLGFDDGCDACNPPPNPIVNPPAPSGSTGATGNTGGTGGNTGSTGPTGVTQNGLDARPNNGSCLAPARPPPTSGVQLQAQLTALAFTQLTQAVRAQFAAAEPFHWLLVERAGLVKLVQDASPATALTFLDLRDRVKSDCPECGLLGLTLDPDFKTTHRLYVSYTSGQGCGPGVTMCSYLSRFTITPNATRTSFTASAEDVLLKIDRPYDSHNGGGLQFGNDGMLYAAFGDGGSYYDALENGQSTNVCMGKMLRLDVSSLSGYLAPADNPFAASCPAGNLCCPLIFAYGLRNPWRFSVDHTTGALWAGDVGQDHYEEVDRVERGKNYGWNCMEATHPFSTTGMCVGATGFTAPIVEYSNDIGARQSITGGFVYRGTAVDALKGMYIFGDYGSREIWAIDATTTGPLIEPAPLLVSPANISTFAEDERGELYALNLYGGQGTQIYKLVPGTVAASTFPQTLSQTGCFTSSTPSEGLIPFDVNAPLWSDGATKRRWLALPNGAQMHVEPDGDITLPVGTVLVKEFSLGGARVETRLFVRHDDGGWGGYSYQWNAAGTEATLLADRAEALVNGVDWTFPSRGDCGSCHTEAAGYSLGLELQQLARNEFYPATGRNAPQLQTLAAIGLFDAPLPAATPLPYPHDTTQPLGARARAYLHGNCAGCHRPNGSAAVPPDFRYAVSLAGTGVCNAVPQRGTLGLSDARLLAPGSPARSVISARMHATSGVRMPPLGTSLVDAAGTALIDGWIAATTTCP